MCPIQSCCRLPSLRGERHHNLVLNASKFKQYSAQSLEVTPSSPNSKTSFSGAALAATTIATKQISLIISIDDLFLRFHLFHQTMVFLDSFGVRGDLHVFFYSEKLRPVPRVRLKKVTDLTMIYFIWPKQPTNQPPSQPPHSAVGKAPSSSLQGRGLNPSADHRFFRFFLFLKKKYVRAFSQPETTNQPVIIFSIMRSEKN